MARGVVGVGGWFRSDEALKLADPPEVEAYT